MQALDEQLAQVRAEIVETERAAPLIETVIVERLAEVEQASASFRAAPFSLAASTPAVATRQLLGALATLMPDATRALIEAHVREVEERRLVVRLAPEAKQTKLTALHVKARQLEAKLELQRRQHEAIDPDTTFTRADADPEVWFADDAELRTMAATNGRQR